MDPVGLEPTTSGMQNLLAPKRYMRAQMNLFANPFQILASRFAELIDVLTPGLQAHSASVKSHEYGAGDRVRTCVNYAPLGWKPSALPAELRLH